MHKYLSKRYSKLILSKYILQVTKSTSCVYTYKYYSLALVRSIMKTGQINMQEIFTILHSPASQTQCYSPPAGQTCAR